MAKKCDLTGTGAMSGNNVSHSKRHTRTHWSPNVQKVNAIVNGTKKRVCVCTSCLKSGKVQRTI